ncbi:MAG TPA: M15 family metallopeptidase [Ilumatobacteraceae bacterium]|nr:M15 family metallopeptidase [Ilumatobacteraceae bacterium]
MRTRLLAGLTALLVGAIALPVVVAGQVSVDRAAKATTPAVRSAPIATDVVSIFNTGPLRTDVTTQTIAAARQAGASLAFGRSASVGMVGLYRGAAAVQLPPAGFAYPMGVTGLPPEAIAATMGRDVSALLAPDARVMGETSAGLRGATAGDTAQLVAASGGIVVFRIAAILPDARVGGAEFLMSNAAADRLGVTELRRALLWNPSSRGAMDSALAANALVSTSIRIRRSWDPPDPDDTIGMARTKALLGEFAYRVNANDSVSQDAAWVAASLPSGRVLLNDSIQITARCHNVIEPALRAALAEIAAQGLGGTIDVANANAYGGCHQARFNRLTPDSTVGFLSRHSWGMAFDTNTVGSCQGCAPPDFATRPGGCSAVQIFRKHGFAWGGNFLTRDGMHFEYVGERRDLLAYPSRWCQNSGGAAALTDEEAGIDTFFADDGLTLGEH